MILKISSLIFMLLFSCKMFAQYDKQVRDAMTTYQAEGDVESEKDNKSSVSKAFDIAEQLPSFKGNLNQWISANLTYPAVAMAKLNPGVNNGRPVRVRFTIPVTFKCKK